MPAKTTPPAPTASDRLYRVEEVSELTQLSVDTLRLFFRDGRIRTIKLGRNRLVPADEMRRILTEGI